MAPNDRATQQSTNPHVSDSGLGDDLRSFLGDASPAPAKSPRVRDLRPTFRAVPGSNPGLPGTKAFAPHRSDSRASGRPGRPARARLDRAPAAVARADDSEGRNVALQPANGSGTAAECTAEPTDARPGGRGVRGRLGRKASQAVRAGSKTRGAGDEATIGTKTRGAKGKSAKADGVEDKSAPKYVPTEAERQDARRLFREIGQRFNQNRKKSKTAAYTAYRHDLMENMDTLIMGGATDLKEITVMITNLEQYTRETEAESTETPATILGRWLRMDAAEIAELEKGSVVAVGEVEEEVEEEAEEEESGEQIDELDSSADPADDGDSEAVS